MIPVFLITGFLGSGKTSFLRNVIEKLSNSRKLGIIINEFAPAGVDGQSLSDLIQLANHNPDFIFVETSGLSDPIAIVEYFTDRKLINKAYLAHTWCLVDR